MFFKKFLYFLQSNLLVSSGSYYLFSILLKLKDQFMRVGMELCYVLSHFSCVQLFATLWTIIACQAPLSMGFPRQE